MSRIGKKEIEIPEKTEVTLDGTTVSVKGPKGEISKMFRPVISIEIDGKVINFKPKRNDKFTRSLWGTYSSHISNMIKGVNEGFEKKLIIEGVGFRAEASGGKVVLNIGFSHPVELEIPEGVEVSVEKNEINIKGIDKEKVGQFASDIRSKKKPEPYKGKGIRYEGEVIRRKEGKKAAAAA
jgi:large subunit ribosomal protein L6